jgi:hypothetical protein
MAGPCEDRTARNRLHVERVRQILDRENYSRTWVHILSVGPVEQVSGRGDGDEPGMRGNEGRGDRTL